jgi:hypothetical protein
MPAINVLMTVELFLVKPNVGTAVVKITQATIVRMNVE